MADIFISYSRKDSKQALALAERLRKEGLSVWIDQQGIDFAASWSGQIVDAIEGCQAFVILLSASSLQSENVVRELSLAFETHRKILPIELESIELTRDFRYHLAGIQRTSIDNIDAVLAAIRRTANEPQIPAAATSDSHSSRNSTNASQSQNASPGVTGARRGGISPIKIGIAITVLLVIAASIWLLTRSTGMSTPNVQSSEVNVVGLDSADAALIRRFGSKNPSANRLFLRARQLATLGDSAHQAEYRATLQSAIALDTTFAVAIANLASSYLGMRTDSTRALARKYAMRAIVVGPKVPTGYAVMGSIAAVDKDYDGEYGMASRAIELDSTATMGWSVLHAHFARLGDFPKMVQIEKRILSLDAVYAGQNIARFYNNWLDSNMDSIAKSFSHDWVTTLSKYVDENPNASDAVGTLVFMLDDLNSPRAADLARKIEVFTGNNDQTYNYACTLCIYYARHHRDAEVRRFFDIGIKYCGQDLGTYLMRHNVMRPYASQPPFNEYVSAK